LDFNIIAYKKSGRVETLSVGGKNYSGREVREKLGLPSSCFTIDYANGKYTFTTKGSGHGVGMSQYGAQAMALDGASEIIVYNRSKKAEFIKIINNTIKETNCKIKFKLLSDLDSLKQDMHNSYLFINTTGVGMEPMLDQSVVPDESYFSSQLKVADIIYQPATTKLLQMAKNAGCKVMNGELMLLYQGAESFKIWTGKDMPIDKVKKVLGIGVKK